MARYKRHFWLDASKDDELLLLETIDELKAERKFSRAIRDGLRLFVSLSRGETDVLERLFPAVVARLRESGNSSSSGGGSDDRLARIESLILQIQQPAGMLHAARESVASATGGQQPGQPGVIDAPDFELPTFDDDDDLSNLLQPAKPRQVDVVGNFMRAVSGLTG